MTAKAKPVPERAVSGFFHTKRGRDVIENLTAYAFLTPAFLIIFIFSIFPVAFAFIVSLHRWRRFPDDWRGLDSYVDAIGNFAYVAFFWIAIAAFVYGIYTLYRMWRETREKEEPASISLVIPGLAWAAVIAAFVNWFYYLILVIFNIPVRLRGQETTRETFVNELVSSFSFPDVAPAADLLVIAFIVAVVLTVGFVYLLKPNNAQNYIVMGMLAGVAFAAGAWLLNLTITEMNVAISEAVAEGETLPIWSQTILIGAGAGLLGVGLWLWNRTVNRHDTSTRGYVLRVLAVSAMVVGAVFLIRELPVALSATDDDVRTGFSNTIWYSLLSVPFQISLGMILAVLLFQNIRFKSFFRVVFFLPYITPFVATSVVFALLFSPSETSMINQFIGLIGADEQIWLLQPQGIFALIFGDALPAWAAGPSLALVVIILYNIWVYAGYTSVIFLAGLGNIPEDVYEAARIDGANAWQQFRHITIPLLSPVTFFLTLIATIGTFQAFTQIFLMRKIGAYDAVNTINLYIYDEITSSNPNYAYGSAMAFVLFAVILILTLVQNRIAEKRVFYG